LGTVRGVFTANLNNIAYIIGFIAGGNAIAVFFHIAEAFVVVVVKIIKFGLNGKIMLLQLIRLNDVLENFYLHTFATFYKPLRATRSQSFS